MARLGDKLAEIESLLDWEAFRPIVGELYNNKSERGGRPLHIDWIMRALDVKRGLVAYHLLRLEEKGFVKSNYGIFILLELKKGTALRMYSVTDKVADVKAKLEKELYYAGTIARV